jgi:hypothetical protein
VRIQDQITLGKVFLRHLWLITRIRHGWCVSLSWEDGAGHHFVLRLLINSLHGVGWLFEDKLLICMDIITILSVERELIIDGTPT